MEWQENRPGFLEADLVPHCGDSPEGFYLNTLSTVDIATGRSECVAVWGKGQERVGAQCTECGSFAYCQREKTTFTRSRSYKQNDNCYVEQKNWSVVRRLIGYDRYNSKAPFEALNRIYNLLRPYVNYFQPVMKLVSKTRHGAKMYKVYDTARTPYQRLLESGVLTEAKQREVAATYHGLNPALLLKQINENLESLRKLAVLPADQQRKAKNPEGVGNIIYEAAKTPLVTVFIGAIRALPTLF